MAPSDAALAALRAAGGATPAGPLLLSVVLGSESRVRRFIDSQKLLEWAAAAAAMLDNAVGARGGETEGRP